MTTTATRLETAENNWYDDPDEEENVVVDERPPPAPRLNRRSVSHAPQARKSLPRRLWEMSRSIRRSESVSSGENVANERIRHSSKSYEETTVVVANVEEEAEGNDQTDPDPHPPEENIAAVEPNMGKSSLFKKISVSAGDCELQAKLLKWKVSADTASPVFSSGGDDSAFTFSTATVASHGQPSSKKRPPLPEKPARFHQRQLRRLLAAELAPPENKRWPGRERERVASRALDLLTMHLRAEARRTKLLSSSEMDPTKGHYDVPLSVQQGAKVDVIRDRAKADTRDGHHEDSVLLRRPRAGTMV